MTLAELKNCLQNSPIISAVQDNLWEDALASPVEVVFHLKANILTVEEKK